jgi:CRISPR-associated protein Cas1
MKRTIEVSTRGLHVYVKAHRVVIQDDDRVLGAIPVEDIGTVVIGSDGIRLSSGVLGALAGAGVAVLFCDGKHLPEGLLLPVAGNSLHAERVALQAAMSEPLRKNLWKLLVKSKIRNQAYMVRDSSAEKRLYALAGKVASGDRRNLEAQAAQAYWPVVFLGVLPGGSDVFRRRPGGAPPNGLLNYGYSVLRSTAARALVAAGLHPGLGVHHRNRYSGFPLADDLMEPYRPFVDEVVKRLTRSGAIEVDQDTKPLLLSVLATTIRLGETVTPLAVAMERSAQTLMKAINLASQGNPALEAACELALPRFTADTGSQ